MKKKLIYSLIQLMKKQMDLNFLLLAFTSNAHFKYSNYNNLQK